jgi:hypothetical protein
MSDACSAQQQSLSQLRFSWERAVNVGTLRLRLTADTQPGHTLSPPADAKLVATRDPPAISTRVPNLARVARSRR